MNNWGKASRRRLSFWGRHFWHHPLKMGNERIEHQDKKSPGKFSRGLIYKNLDILVLELETGFKRSGMTSEVFLHFRIIVGGNRKLACGVGHADARIGT